MSSSAAWPVRTWRALAPEQRLAALAALGLFVSMLLPWYSLTPKRAGETRVLSAFGDFSFVELAVLLVAVAVLLLLVARAEGRAFHLPGGDGTIVILAGAWVAFLVFYRLIDKPGETAVTVTGVRWGIFVTLLSAIVLAYAGVRMRAAHRPEPPLPGERPPRTRPTSLAVQEVDEQWQDRRAEEDERDPERDRAV